MIRRILWRVLLGWTLFLAVLLPFDIGEAEIRHWVNPMQLQSFFIGILRVAEIFWLTLGAAVVYFYLIQTEGVSGGRRAAITILLGSLFVSILNLRTGFPFGPMVFTGRLGARIFGVPVGVPLLWLMMLVSARYVVLHFWEHARRWQIAVGTGFLAVLTDLSLEWVAWRIRAWWLWYFPLANTPDLPPWQNYLAWFGLGSLFTWIAFPPEHPVGRHGKMVVLFLAINLLFWLTIIMRRVF